MKQTKLDTVCGSPSCKSKEIAGIIVAPDTYIGFRAGLIARAEQNHEYGLRGRCS